MLTITQVFNENEFMRSERIFAATEVSKTSPDETGRVQLLVWRTADTPEELTNGVVYVANAQGKTVAKYDLNATHTPAA